MIYLLVIYLISAALTMAFALSFFAKEVPIRTPTDIACWWTVSAVLGLAAPFPLLLLWFILTGVRRWNEKE